MLSGAQGEMDAFVAALRRPLPLTFRVNATGKYADYVTAKLSSEFYAGLQVADEGEPAAGGAEERTLEPPRPLDWCVGPRHSTRHICVSLGGGECWSSQLSRVSSQPTGGASAGWEFCDSGSSHASCELRKGWPR